MKKKDLKKRILELEQQNNIQKILINQLQWELDGYKLDKNKVEPKIPVPNLYPEFDADACPMGGKHEFTSHTTGGMMCKCGKTKPPDYIVN